MPPSRQKPRSRKAARRGVAAEPAKRFDRDLGARLRRLRLRRGLSQHELAAAVGLTLRRVREHEAATKRITADNLVRYAEALNVRLSEFFK